MKYLPFFDDSVCVFALFSPSSSSFAISFLIHCSKPAAPATVATLCWLCSRVHENAINAHMRLNWNLLFLTRQLNGQLTFAVCMRMNERPRDQSYKTTWIILFRFVVNSACCCANEEKSIEPVDSRWMKHNVVGPPLQFSCPYNVLPTELNTFKMNCEYAEEESFVSYRGIVRVCIYTYIHLLPSPTLWLWLMVCTCNFLPRCP